MDLNKCLTQAASMASKAKPWNMVHNGVTYTAVFNQNEWVYDVFEDGFFMLKINHKSPTKARAFLQHYLTH